MSFFMADSFVRRALPKGLAVEPRAGGNRVGGERRRMRSIGYTGTPEGTEMAFFLLSILLSVGLTMLLRWSVRRAQEWRARSDPGRDGTTPGCRRGPGTGRLVRKALTKGRARGMASEREVDTAGTTVGW